MNPLHGWRGRSGALLVATSAFLACGETPPPVKAPVTVAPSASAAPIPDPPDGPIPSLRTGTLTPVERSTPIAGQVERRSVEAGLETLVVRLLLNDDQAAVSTKWPLVIATSDDPRPVAFATHGDTQHDVRPVLLWIRRPAALAGQPLDGDVFARSQEWAKQPGEHHRFHADDPTRTSDPKLFADWERALADQLSESRASEGPWQAFAAAKLRDLAPKPAKVQAPAKGHPVVLRPTRSAPQQSDELARLMETTTGVLAIQEALQSDRSLFLTAAQEPRKVALSAVKGPELARHPWADMSRALGVAVPAEPLAAAAPAEFYYARAASLPVLFRLLDQVDAWGTPAARVFDGNAEERGLAARYEGELGIGRGPLTRALGPSVVTDLAVIGSDPYLKEGTDVTLVFRVKDRALFDTGLAVALAEHAKAHGAMAPQALTLAGTSVTVTRSVDGAVHQHRASAGGFELVSNSAGALTRVLETIAGKHPRLSDEPDFRYMLARDAGTKADVLAYASDRFVAEVVGPRQKIGEARRQIALAELMTPGFAALLYGEMNGASPTTVADLTKAHLLSPKELTHTNGGAIAWKPGEAARSEWGTVAAMTPLIDLPAVENVTASERAGYERFSRSYQYDWAHYVDPIAIRLAFEAVGPTTRMTMDLRQLPLLEETEYGHLGDLAGDARFETGGIADGARVVFGIGERSLLRRLASEIGSVPGHRDLTFDWIGDWATVGVRDRSQVAHAALTLLDRELPQPPKDGDDRSSRVDVIKAVSKLPLYAAIGVKNPVSIAITLAAAHALAEESTPGLLSWGEASKYRDVSIVRIAVDSKRAKEEFGEDVEVQVFYAITRGALILSFSEPTLRGLIDDRLDGKAPKAPADKAGGEQMTLELASDKGRAVWTALMWELEGEVLHHDSGFARANAELLFRGAPERANDPVAWRALALAYFGSVPLPTDGGAFTFTKEGVRDPNHGTPYAPIWPALPVPGSPVDALMTAIAHARADVAFDDEGKVGKEPLRSLHARVAVDLHGPLAE